MGKKNETLFKYLDAKGAKKMLKNSNLQFTRATKLNDPFDCHPSLVKTTREFNTPSFRREKDEDKFSKLRELSFVCSLSDMKDSIPMWSYYAKNHEGVCVELDTQGIRSKVFPCRDFNIVYSTSLADSLCNPSPSTLGLEELEHMLKTKAKDWEHEKEVRIITMPDKYEEDVYRPEIGEECFVSIYLGANISKRNKNAIIILAQKINPNIKIYQMEPDEKEFKLNPIEVS